MKTPLETGCFKPRNVEKPPFHILNFTGGIILTFDTVDEFNPTFEVQGSRNGALQNIPF